jgi:hypothetical protein
VGEKFEEGFMALGPLALAMVGVVSLGITALGALGVLVAAARPAIASLEPGQDRALRRLSAGRTLCAVVGAQVVLAGDLVPGTAYLFLPVDSVECQSFTTPAESGWLPGLHHPGGLIILAGAALSLAGCLVWAAWTWRTSTRALVPFTAGDSERHGATAVAEDAR